MNQTWQRPLQSPHMTAVQKAAYKALEGRTYKEVFELVRTHLLAQKATSLSLDEDACCLYRGPNGLKCAIGCLISDEDYTYDMEGTGIDTLIYANLEVVHDPYMEMLGKLQTLHDEVEPEHWETALAELHSELFPELWLRISVNK